VEVHRSSGGGVCQDQSDDTTHRDGEDLRSYYSQSGKVSRVAR